MKATASLAGDRGKALALFPLPAKVQERLELYAELLVKWQKAINLVAASTLPQIWTRHFADSLQVQAAAPQARHWVDLGSGAGFPGLVTAIRLAEEEGARVHLIESDQRKCAFLREVSRETGAPAIVHPGRIEQVVKELDEPIDAVSARALAPLPDLLTYAEKYLAQGAVGVFPLGQVSGAQLTDSPAFRRYQISTRKSSTSSSSRLAIVRRIARTE